MQRTEPTARDPFTADFCAAAAVRSPARPAGGAGRASRARRPWAAVLGAAALAAVSAAEATTRIAGVTHVADAPTVVAERRGYFAAHGLETELRYHPSGKEALARLRADEADFALMALAPLVIDSLTDTGARGPSDPVILANLVHATHLNRVVAPPPGPVERPPDLAGRRVGLTQGTNAALVWWLFARHHGLDESAALKLVDHAPDTLIDALARGTVDAAVLWEPWIARLQEHTGGSLHRFGGGYTHTAHWVLVTRRETCRDQAQRCRALLAAYDAAVGFIQRQPDAARQLYAEHLGLDPVQLRRAWVAPSYSLSLDWSLVAGLQQQFDWAQRAHGIATAGGRPSIAALLAPGPLRALAPSAVGVPPLEEDGP